MFEVKLGGPSRKRRAVFVFALLYPVAMIRRVNSESVATLSTPRLRLRAFRADDRGSLLQIQMDPLTMASYGGGSALSQAEAERVLQDHVECRQYPYWAWAVTLARDDASFG